MLIEFSASNFKSIKSTQTFSLMKGKGAERELSNTFETERGLKLLRSAAMYGPNAGGKSNFIKALEKMEQIIVESASKGQRGEELPYSPFRLDRKLENAPTEFEAIFVKNGIRYQYGFAYTRTRIMEEWLFAFPKGRAQRWFSRDWVEEEQQYSWEMGAELKGQKHLWQEATRENALFLSTAVQLNSEQLQPVFDWYKKTLRTAGVGEWTPTYSAYLCEEKGEKNRILEFLRAADISIDDIEINREKFDSRKLSGNIPEGLRKQLEHDLEDKFVLDLKTIHETEDNCHVTFDFEEESDGTQKLFSLAGPWLDCLQNGYVLFVDELHDNLHPYLVRYLVDLFNNAETNPLNAQLVFTTHETSILSQDVFRRDQIWFCEKDKSQATTIFPLTDFSPRKNRENLELSYLAGRYGALPFVRKLKTA